ncbi:fibronectin-like [Asterias amurensis]|uniref:fibronectin-like n=1 Tax=Asterias amurensis TaxID=7602 RepID=UPI003AB4E40E
MKSFSQAAATTGREIWVAHTTRGASKRLLASFVVLLAVACVYSTPTIECPVDKQDDADSGESTTSVALNTPTVANADVRCDWQSSDIFSIGTTAVTCTATDDDGNTATCVYYVIITDNQPPTIDNVPTDVRVSISLEDLKFPNAGAVAKWQAPATIDNSNLVTLSSTHQSGETFPIGETTVKYTAIDRAGNTVDKSFSVRVLVKPPDDDVFVTGARSDNSMACMTLFWPETGDQETESYGLFFWKQGDSRPLSEQRKIQTADASKTYVKYEHCGLLPGELYNVEVQNEPASEIVGKLQFWTKPNLVQLRSPETNAVNTSFDLSWELSSDNVDQYLLQVHNYYGNGNVYAEYFTKTTDRTRIEGLPPGTQVMVFISAVVGSGDMRQKGATSRYGPPFTTALPAVDELIAYNYTESTIAVAWGVSDINSPLLSSSEPFMIFINSEGTEESFQIISSGPLVAEFTGLEPNTDYEIKVIHNVMQVGLTTTQKTRPVRANNVRATAIESSSITLEWEQSTTEGVKYELYISPGERSDPIPPEAETSHTFSQLKNNTEYFIKIVATYDGMKSVPKTLLVTTGVTKPTVPSSALTTLIIVAAVLGSLVLVLALVILVACIKLRRLQKNSPQVNAKVGQTNVAMDTPRGPSRGGKPDKQEQQQDYGGEYAEPAELGISQLNYVRRDDKPIKSQYHNSSVLAGIMMFGKNKPTK